eukprot:scaffold2163_cov158-Ochromonas_danica.AAC.7
MQQQNFFLWFLLLLLSFHQLLAFGLGTIRQQSQQHDIRTTRSFLHRPSLIERHRSVARYMAEIPEFGDEEGVVETKPTTTATSPTTAASTKATYGYEGNFKVGDVVRVSKNIVLYHVKGYTKQGLDCNGFVGTVQALLLYGKKYGTLCSAITPIKVEFLPDGEGIPPGKFDRKWSAHFSCDELELVQAAQSS